MTIQRSSHEASRPISSPPVELGPLHTAAACPEAAARPVDHTSEAPAITALERRGFTAHFTAHDDHLLVADTGRRFRPDDVTIRDYYRFEGTSDPDDMSVVYALEARDGTRGVLVDAFGSYADPDVGALLSRMRVNPSAVRSCASRTMLTVVGVGVALVGLALAWLGAVRFSRSGAPRGTGAGAARRAA